MNIKQRFQMICGIGFILLQISCGAINSPPGPQQSTGDRLGQKTSKNDLFLVHLYINENRTPILGDNAYQARIVSAGTLEPLPSSAKVTFVIQMPEMPSMGEEQIVAVRTPNGTYEASLFYGMAGRWQITLLIEDGTLKDNYDFFFDL